MSEVIGRALKLRLTRSTTFEMTPPGPAFKPTTSSVNHCGILLPVFVQDCVILPDATACDGKYVVDDILRGLNIRSETNVVYDTLAYADITCAVTMYI